MPLNFELQPFDLIDPVKQFIEALFPMLTTDYIENNIFSKQNKNTVWTWAFNGVCWETNETNNVRTLNST